MKQNIKLPLISLTILFSAVSFSNNVSAGRIILANDEWPTSNTGFINAPDVSNYVLNIADLFADGSPGQFHAYSTNFSLTGISLANTMTAAGHSWSTGTGVTFDLPTLLSFDGIFLAGNTVDLDILTDYVNAGGNVYLAAGITSAASTTANNWNPWLNQFGLSLASTISIGSGNEAISSTHRIFKNVSALYQAGGQEVFDLNPLDMRNQVLEFNSSGIGLYAIYDDVSNVPVPAAAWLFGSGIIGLVGVARRKKS